MQTTPTEQAGTADRGGGAPPSSPPDRPLQPAAGACAALRVLVVEDDAVIAMVLADSLEGAGHRVVGPASTVAEALALCEGAPPPDLAVLDINLRDGSSGVDVARALSERWGVPSIFASGAATDARRARDVALGHIRKPYAPRTVLLSIEAARAVMRGAEPGAVPAGFELFSAAG